MRLPALSPPVKRPHFIQPSLSVDIEHGSIDELVAMRMRLLHGANYNDPAAYANRSFNQVMHSSASSASQGWGGFGGMGRFY
ncbi:cyanobactin biosynthesis system PatB/AcyB/McaB family protein [Crocosphaera sp. XPORK-15E]|uniref:cyanobactin biosynthesis system PatB/AcyB/McaB family protein n=1 Tax=Crocosphaera sp. XPORK-15E TaxID=3110247 RepID=UPI002B1FE3FC|nr:cyanobactin biosynthesis system PatB/AcyB/McaB family protein [Crocosphaera sp. XPORK-15E]MEA5536885.1 cyanobactin biosynthesis system PatB/AcyB/McaB family protein [Crocosphaera sp. XPORK-15E]